MAASPTLYDVLDVDAAASAAQIRRAYLALARAHHPDFHAAAGDAARVANEREMQRINDAWAVLGDPARRRAYDEALRLGRTSEAAAGGAGAARGRRPADHSFTPLDDDDTDYAAVLDDTPVEGTKVSRGLQLLPVVGVAVGFAVLVVGMVVQVSFLLAWGAVAFAIGVLAFVATPFIAVMRSYQADREP